MKTTNLFQEEVSKVSPEISEYVNNKFDECSKQWEYSFELDLDISELNELGKQGWELCTVIEYGSGYKYYLKRQKLIL